MVLAAGNMAILSKRFVEWISIIHLLIPKKLPKVLPCQLVGAATLVHPKHLTLKVSKRICPTPPPATVQSRSYDAKLSWGLLLKFHHL